MTREINIGEVSVDVKVRRPWAVALLSVVTVGIYGIVWYYKVNREMRDYGSLHSDAELGSSEPGSSVLAVTIGSLLVIPPLVSFVRAVRRLRCVEQIATGGSHGGAGLTVLLVGGELMSLTRADHGVTLVVSLLGFAAYLTAIALIQSRLNAVWQDRGVGVAVGPLETAS